MTSKGENINNDADTLQNPEGASSSDAPPLPIYEAALGSSLQPSQLQEIGEDAAKVAEYIWVSCVPGVREAPVGNLDNVPRATSSPSDVSVPAPPTSAPPDYFDISVVPEGSVFTRADLVSGRPQPWTVAEPYTYTINMNNDVAQSNQPQPQLTPLPQSQPLYRIKSETTALDECVVSYDPVLDRNPDALWTYFLENLNTPPQMFVKIRGWHTETRTHTVRTRDSKGHTHTRTQRQTHTVTDFDFKIDVSGFVEKEWSQIVSLPPEGGASGSRQAQVEPTSVYPTFRETLESYTQSDNKLKEITMSKQISKWDHSLLQHNIVAFVKSQCRFREHVDVVLVKKRHKISARSSSKWSRAAHNGCIQCLCVVSCLCIIFWPMWCLVRKRVKNQLIAHYPILLGEQDFFMWNRLQIMHGVRTRSFGTYIAVGPPRL
ncbi:hypothetical protein HK102_012592 [Quaeritorhiza haematococci]|nr:hypothetical protein HK102_012592 [Quaeritorhiza haematococci]